MWDEKRGDYLKEEWKWIKEFEGIYKVSNFGRVKSFKKTDEGYVLSNQNASGDYLRIVLIDALNNRKKSIAIHVLVAEHFIGERPKGFHVHHKDGNKQNNIFTNLEYIHPKEHRKETEKICPQIITGIVNYNKHKKAVPIRQYTKDGEYIAEYANSEIASRITGVCRRNILQVAGKTPFNSNGSVRKQAGGYIWKYANESEVV